MTANQIAYAKQQEEARHNRELESLTRSQNVAAIESAVAAQRQARVAAQRQQEDARHNVVAEQINWFSASRGLEETTRHNMASEAISRMQAESQVTYQQRAAAVAERQAAVAEINAQSQRISAQSALRTSIAQATSATAAMRQAAVSERRAEIAQQEADIKQQQAYIQKYQADIAARQVGVRQSELAESIRFHTISVAETQRHNVVGEQLQHAANVNAAYSTTAQLRQAAAAESRARTEAKRAEISEYEAKTKRGSAYAKGFADVASGIRNLSGTARDIMGIISGR